MAYPTWAEPNLFGNVVHHAPHVEALLCIASEYVHSPLGTSAQVFRHVYPEFNMFEDFRITCISPDCEDYRYSDDEEDNDSDMNENTNSLLELQSAEDAEKEELVSELLELLSGLPTTEWDECDPKEEQTQYETSENTLDVAETVDLEVVRIPDQAMASVSSHDLVRVPLK